MSFLNQPQKDLQPLKLKMKFWPISQSPMQLLMVHVKATCNSSTYTDEKMAIKFWINLNNSFVNMYLYSLNSHVAEKLPFNSHLDFRFIMVTFPQCYYCNQWLYLSRRNCTHSARCHSIHCSIHVLFGIKLFLVP